MVLTPEMIDRLISAHEGLTMDAQNEEPENLRASMLHAAKIVSDVLREG